MKRELLARLEQLEARTSTGIFTLVYIDGHSEQTRDLNRILDEVCATPENGLVAVEPSDVNNLFNAMISHYDE